MGYEVTLFVVERSPLRRSEGKVIPLYSWCEVISAFEMCSLGSDTQLTKLNTETAKDRKDNALEQNYIYAPGGDGNTKVTVDKYEKVLRTRTLDAVITALTRDICGTEGRAYRRYLPVLNSLLALRETWGDTSNLKVLFYGH